MDELSALITLYLELKQNYVTSFAQVRLMDIDRCMALLSKEERISIKLYGYYNLTSRESAAILSVHHSTVIDRYNKARDKLYNMMNGQYENL